MNDIANDLSRVLRVMKFANKKKCLMCIWDIDVTAVENAIAALAANREPVAWRWRFEDTSEWMLRKSRPAHADDVDVICEPMYAS